MESFQLGCVAQDSFPRKSFYVKKGDWDQNTPSNSASAPGTKSKNLERRVHREVFCRSVHLMSVVFAYLGLRRGNILTLHQEGCARRAAWDSGENFHKLKNSDKATFYTLIEEWASGFEGDSGSSMHMMSRKDLSSDEFNSW